MDIVNGEKDLAEADDADEDLLKNLGLTTSEPSEDMCDCQDSFKHSGEGRHFFFTIIVSIMLSFLIRLLLTCISFRPMDMLILSLS